MKKKALTLLFALALLCALTAPALAAEVVELLPEGRYDTIHEFSEGLALVVKNDPWGCGYINRQGELVVPLIYDNGTPFSGGFARVWKWAADGSVLNGYVDQSGREIVPCQYENAAFAFTEGFASVQRGGKWGFVDQTGREVVPCQYDSVTEFAGGLAAVCVTRDGLRRWGVVDGTGREVTPFQYTSVTTDPQGFAVVKLDGKCGLVDRTGRELVPCRYDAIWSFSEGLAWVRENGLYGYIDMEGNEVVPPQYKYAEDFSQGVARVCLDNKWGLIDQTGQEVVSCRYDKIEASDGPLAEVTLGGGKGYIDTAGTEVISPKYSYIGQRSEGRIAVSVGAYPNGSWGFLDEEGNEVVKPQYTGGANAFSEGLALVGRQLGFDKYEYGYIDPSGKEVIPLQFADAKDFSGGIAAVRVDSYWGFIDKTGTLVTSAQYIETGSVSDGLAAVRRYENGEPLWGFIDSTGREVVPPRYTDVRSFSGGLAAVQTAWDKWGVIDTAGRQVIPCVYDSAPAFVDGVAKVMMGNKWGLIDVTGTALTAFRYDRVDDFTDGVAFFTVGTENNGLLGLRNAAAPAAPVAYAATQTVLVDGRAVTFECYALKDANGNDTNYIKLRDIASILNGTAVQFEVGWNGAVNIETGKAYTPNGSEMSTPFRGDRAYEPAAAPTNINGVEAPLEAIVLKDDQGGAYTYYKLRDLGTALGFAVDWSAEKGIFIETV